MTATDDDVALPPQAAAQELTDLGCPISVRTLARWRTAGTGPPYIRVGAKRVAYRRKSLRAWLFAHEVVPPRTRMEAA